MAISITKPTVGGNEDTWGSTINTALDTIIDAVNGTTGTTAPNLSTLTINGTNVTSTAAELNKLDGFTGVVADLNYAKDLRATGVTSTEFDKLDGLTATTAELNKLDGVTATTAEINYLDGVTSNIQTQLNNAGTGSMNSFQLEDGDGTEVTVSDGKEVKFVEGTGIDINWTDTSTGSDGDPYDMTFALKGDQRLSATTDVYVGNAHEHIHFNDGDARIEFMLANVEEMRLSGTGDLDVDGNVTAYSTVVSDQRLKHNIQKIDNALDKVSQINGYTFTYNKDNKKSAGVVAQEIEQVLPSAVNNQKLVFHGQEGIEYKTVQYDQLHGLLIEAIKELKSQIEELKNGI